MSQSFTQSPQSAPLTLSLPFSVGSRHSRLAPWAAPWFALTRTHPVWTRGWLCAMQIHFLLSSSNASNASNASQLVVCRLGTCLVSLLFESCMHLFQCRLYALIPSPCALSNGIPRLATCDSGTYSCSFPLRKASSAPSRLRATSRLISVLLSSVRRLPAPLARESSSGSDLAVCESDYVLGRL